MKKIFFATLAVAALALSCQKNEVVVENPSLNPAIEFGVYTGRAPITRAGVLDNDNFNKFGVTAFYTGENAWLDDQKEAYAGIPNFMYNQDVNKSGESWIYSPIKYWPTQETDKVSFFAYAPYSEDNTYVEITDNNKSGSPKVTVTIPTKEGAGAAMVDFVADVQIDVTHSVDNYHDGGAENTNGNNTRGPVEFKMQHEMTRLALTAALDEDLVTENGQDSWVVIKSIKFGKGENLYYYPKGVYSFADVNDEGNTINRGKWSFEGVTAVEFLLNDYLGFTAGKTYCTDGSQGVLGKTYEDKTLGLNSDDIVNLMTGAPKTEKDDAFLFLLPPKGEQGLDAAKDIVIKYDIVTKDAALNDGYSCTEAEKTVHMPVGFLKQGKAYSLHFTFYVDQIELSATVEDWGDKEDNSIKVPYSPDQPAA